MKTYNGITNGEIVLGCLLIGLGILVSNLTGCATSGYGVNHPAPVLTYRCEGLPEYTCNLVRSAAAVATGEGYPTVENSQEGSFLFVLGPTPSVFFNHQLYSIGPSLRPIPIMIQRGLTVSVNWHTGGIDVRDGDFVDYVVDLLERGRKSDTPRM